jgi:xanthine dehydrogenase accessory factor
VVALTHDPKLDDLALLEALKTDAFYVGCHRFAGATTTPGATHDQHFRADRRVAGRLRGPIGIYIGSKTPPEIAVSVMAEILAVKNGVTLPREMDVAEAKNQRAVLANDPGDVVCGVPGRRR